RLNIQPVKELNEIGQFRYIYYYEVNDLCYYVGLDLTNEETKKLGLKLRVYDSGMNLKFESAGQGDSYTYNPTFFRNPNLSPHTVLLVHISNEGSWGQGVYIIEGEQFKYIGMIEVSNWAKEPEWYSDIAPDTEITKVKDTLIFSFQPSKIVFDPSGREEKVLNGNELRYEYSGGKLHVVNNSE
ncbi:MAG: hypothetical protein HKP49_07490, partial [Maribacter sp.]|nr:hypothetical protein [Maribacter sp.]